MVDKKHDFSEEACSHPLLYLTSYSCNMHFKPPIKLHNCKCLSCTEGLTLGNEVWSGKGEFLFHRDKVIFDINEEGELIEPFVSYEVVRKEFLMLKHEGYSMEEIKEILFFKYSRRNDELVRKFKIKYNPKK